MQWLPKNIRYKFVIDETAMKTEVATKKVKIEGIHCKQRR